MRKIGGGYVTEKEASGSKQGEYESTTDEEYDPKDQRIMRKKRMARNEDPDTEKGESDRLDSKEIIE